MLLSPCIISVAVTIATWFVRPLDEDRGGWGKMLPGIHRMGHPIHLIIKFSALVNAFVNIHTGRKYLHVIFALSERSIHIPLPKFIYLN